ncbi:N-acetyltransferase [Fulvivirgaceae bacterium BMA10]|uniref:N-acetyltransferase n=1 Tax=Splendidivirga corallicola TaxID=3051826 RepID=A0ABT8KW17_9BACT|nr:N-acetyltransferase [Fulvivirgaceae bacterium BMA10]
MQKLKIIPGKKHQITDCSTCLRDSQLWDHYFSNDDHTQSFLTEGIDREEIHVALDESNEVVGFMRIDLKGAFAKFPLLRVIAVRKEFRKMGFGEEMLSFYEKIGFKNANKLFLFVSDFNKQAKKLYTKTGYQKVGEIPDLYIDDITEYLMMKVKS